jgi:hypothetical protein
MVFFLALAAKEVFEATLPGGELASPGSVDAGSNARPRQLVARMGDSVRHRHRLLGNGRARDLSCGSPGHPFLLLPAIADDALGLLILAVFSGSGSCGDDARTPSFWPYVVGAGALRGRRFPGADSILPGRWFPSPPDAAQVHAISECSNHAKSSSPMH